MSFLEFVVKSEWPAVILILVFYFRSSIRSILNELKITKASFGAGSIEFQKKMDDLEQISTTSNKLNGHSKTEKIENTENQLVNIEEQHLSHWSEVQDWCAAKTIPDAPPPYMIIMYWNQLEKTLAEGVEKLTAAHVIPDMKRNTSSPILWRNAAEIISLSKQTINGIKELQILRNQAAHGKELNIDLTDALRYRDLTNKFISIINERISEMLDRNR